MEGLCAYIQVGISIAIEVARRRLNTISNINHFHCWLCNSTMTSYPDTLSAGDLNSEFSFSYNGKSVDPTKAREPCLPYYLPISKSRRDGFTPFPGVKYKQTYWIIFEGFSSTVFLTERKVLVSCISFLKVLLNNHGYQG